MAIAGMAAVATQVVTAVTTVGSRVLSLTTTTSPSKYAGYGQVTDHTLHIAVSQAMTDGQWASLLGCSLAMLALVVPCFLV